MTAAVRLAAALAGRYAIDRELGAGGMATVYVARDLKHDREVAIKVLHPELAAVLGAERFLQEIRVSARLDHPHILTLIDSGESNGFVWYVLPYVRGESLRQKLTREKQLAVEDAVRIAMQVASALDYAHRHGIIHRDIKPENILLHEGEAVVADFGIALAVQEAGGPRLTQSGVSLGTPLYMSPEQATGGRELDARSDVYSLAAVVYEMLAGEPPHTGPTARAVIAKLLTERPTPLRTVRDTVPEGIDATLTKALAKVSTDRYGGAAEFAATLAVAARTPSREPSQWSIRVVLAACAVAVMLSVIGYAILTDSHRPADKSIAVLPLVNESGATEDQIRSDGMTEALIDGLSHVPGLRVPSRTQVFAYRNAGLDSRSIGARLHVATILEGSYQRVGSVLQVSLRLVNANDGYVLWSDTFRRDPKDVFAVQDAISQAVVGALRLRLAGDARPVGLRPTENLAAYEFYLKGRWYWNERGGGAVPLRQAIGFFTQAIALDSNYARAWAGLADAYSMLPAFSDAVPAEAFPEAKRAAERALALDSTLAEAHTSAGIISVFHDWDWAAAAREFDRALALDSTEPRTHLFHAWYYVAQGQLADALREVRRAQQLNPTSTVINTRVGSTLYYLRRYDDAKAELRQALVLDSTNRGARSELGRVLVQQHRFAEALAAFPDVFDLQAGYLGGGSLGYAYGMAGRRAEARAIERRLERRAQERYIDPEALALVDMGEGDTARALGWLERGVRERSFYLPFIAADPIFAPLHGNPRFLQILRTVGLHLPSDSAP